MARGRRADRHAVEKSAYRLEARRAVFGLEGDLPEPGQHGRRAYLFGVGKRTRALSRSGIDTLPLQCGYNRAMPRVCFERSPDARDEATRRFENAPQLRETRGAVGEELQTLQAQAQVERRHVEGHGERARTVPLDRHGAAPGGFARNFDHPLIDVEPRNPARAARYFCDEPRTDPGAACDVEDVLVGLRRGDPHKHLRPMEKHAGHHVFLIGFGRCRSDGLIRCGHGRLPHRAHAVRCRPRPALRKPRLQISPFERSRNR